MKAGIIGATGYAGAELARILAGHPEIDGMVLSSVSFEGEQFEGVYPNVLGRISAPLVKADEVIAAADVVFAALPHGVGESYAAACVAKGIPFIDLSADFRFGGDEVTYNAWYGKPYQYPELHHNAVYGLPELNRERIRGLRAAASGAASGGAIIGNPGCYPTGASLGAFPALAQGLALDSAAIIIDSASGVSGGGREPSRSFHYPECADSIAPYKIGSHRHTPEIERNFAAMVAKENRPTRELIFTPHLAPMNRGILSTIYIPLAAEWRSENPMRLHTLYTDFYRDEPFVRVLPADVIAATNRVRQSNYCDISVHLNHRKNTLIVVTAIDNMVKGAAGQAVQNMNILFGFNERAGLEMIPALF